MELKNKEWLNLVLKIADYHDDAVIILNDSFEIIFSNTKANSIFYVDECNLALNQIFESDTCKKLSDKIGICLSTLKSDHLKGFDIILKSNETIKLNLSIEILEIEKSKQVYLLFHNSENKNSVFQISRIKLGDLRGLTVEQIENVKYIIKAVKTLYPFTIVSSKRINSIIDEYKVPIVLKDSEGKIIAINSTYSSSLGVENSIAMGKKLEAFLPPNLVHTYQMIDEQVKLSKQSIVLDGRSGKSNNIEVFKSYIQIPVLDNLNKIIALIGLIIDIMPKNPDSEFELTGLKNIIKELPNAVALIDVNGKILEASSNFADLIGENSQDVIDKTVVELFSKSVKESFDEFVEEKLVDFFVKVDENFIVTFNKNYIYELTFKRLENDEKRIRNFLLVITKPDNFEKSFDDLQNILMYRGKMFDILIEKNPEPIFIYDKENLRFLEVNKAAINLYGYSRDEFLQMDLTDLYSPEDIQTLLDSFGDESSESRFSKPFRHRKKDGSNVLVEISKTSFIFNEREAHFNIVRDITKDVATDKQNQMLKAIFSEAEMMIFTTDASGFITFVNHKVSEKLGYSNEELVQSSLASLVVDDDRGIVNTSIFQSYLKDTIALETKFKTIAGNYVDVEIFASPIFDFDGETDSFTIVVKSKHSLEEIVKPGETVKEVIKEVVKEVIVEKPVKVEQKSLIPDSNFLSGMFHEILTPINVIIGFSQELISSAENPTEEQKEAAEIINQNRIKMMDTMNSVVEYSDIIQNKSPLKIDDITITEIIEKLDNNIKDISGINDILFSYGKISSSLKFKSDKQKFESFILSLIKVVSRISKDKKIYFSSFPLDAEYFVLGISDQYGNPSDYVSNVLEQVYINNKDPKDFGLPKLTTYLSRTLLSLLDGKFYRSSAISVRPETGFIFPIFFKPKSDAQFIDSISEPVLSQTVYEPEAQIADFNLVKTNVEEIIEQPKTEIVEDNLSDIPTGQVDFADVEESQITSSDIESVSEAVDNIQTVEDYYAAFANEVTAEELKLAEAKAETEKLNVMSEEPVQEDLVNEIKKELKTEVIAEQEVVIPKSVDLSKLSCLYIEDQIDSQILFKVQMKGLNDIKFAAGFEDAQLLLLNHQFDFIVMDINLQGEYNGLDALKIIKTMPALSSIPIIAVTAYVLPGDKEKFIVAGFDDFISKPIFREKMMESLEKIFLS